MSVISFGVKQIDNLMARYGLAALSAANAWQNITVICYSKRIEQAKNQPYCMQKSIVNIPANDDYYLHQFFLPKQDKNLASFLFDRRGQLIEQVYFQKGHHYTQACRKLERLLRQKVLMHCSKACPQQLELWQAKTC